MRKTLGHLSGGQSATALSANLARCSSGDRANLLPSNFWCRMSDPTYQIQCKPSIYGVCKPSDVIPARWTCARSSHWAADTSCAAQAHSECCNRAAAAGMHQDCRVAGTLHKGPRYVHTQECLGLARSTGVSRTWTALMEWLLLLLLHMQAAARTDHGRRHMSAKHIQKKYFQSVMILAACMRRGILTLAHHPVCCNCAYAHSFVSSNCMQSISLKRLIWAKVLNAHTSCGTLPYIHPQRIE